MGTGSGDGSGRSSGRVLGWGLGLGGVALLGFAAITIHDFVDAVARRAPIVAWDSGGWIALPVALALLALAAALFIGRHQGPDVDGPRSDAIRRLLVLAAGLLPFAIVLPLGAKGLAAAQLEARGYVQCGDGLWIAQGRMSEVADATARCAAAPYPPI
ncbi:hypothetical protein [Porphyrobacter sp. YT40]|uniref:hypothetical protein n=1 Tax=Porphyrobacter sp. YT40 TaxID=2547601 RepID=UPI0011415C61|nr:hypothetical protein [Porphyrobacter sp. YT40]QDH33499.1 hypothetical protein E2E27_03575 [Porphyrobacter sp. YT40]